MQLREVRTRDDLIKFLIESGRSTEDRAAKDADWFVLCTNARMMFDSYTVKDLASTLQDGIPVFKPEEDVAYFLETYFEDADIQADIEGDDEALKDVEETLTELLVNHFGR